MNSRVTAPAALFSSASVVLAVACASGNVVKDTMGTAPGNDSGSASGGATTDGSATNGDDDGGVNLGGGGGGGGDDASSSDASSGCDAGATSCSGRCVDTASDVRNCGACGAECGAGQMCTNGSCGCAGGYSVCSGGDGGNGGGASGSTDGASAALVCSNVQTDIGNCGACGNVCSGIMGCSGGACVAPVVVDSSGTCTLLDGSMNHALAVDSSGRIYAGLLCNGIATVAVSANGTSFAAGVALGVSSADSVTNLALATSGTTVYAAIGSDAATYFSLSTDGGVTWSSPTTLAATTPDGFLQVAVNGTNVFVGTPGAVFRNGASGVGTFASSPVTGGAPSGGIGVGSDGTIWLASVASSTVSLSKSTDGGLSFSAFASAGAENEYFPAFAFGPSGLAVVGTTPSSGDDALVSIAYAAPTVETVTTGIAPVAATAQSRTVAVDASGAAYTFGGNGATVVAQSFTAGQLSAPVLVASDEEVQNVAIAAGTTATAYGMWSVGANIRLFHFSF